MDIKAKKTAILGYGNQGRAQALNLRDSGICPVIGARKGSGFEQAVRDGFEPVSFQKAAESSEVLMFLVPDLVIPEIYSELTPFFKDGERSVGFAHGYAFQFGGIEKFPKTPYFLVGPKGAGSVLRKLYQSGKTLPGVIASVSPHSETLDLARSYALAIGLSPNCLIETSFQEETECDLFSEQVVLCGGIVEIMESAFEILVEKGHSPEMAFLECCYEAKLILDLWMSAGPSQFTQKISPTAFYGGLTRGKRLIDSESKQKMRAIFQEIREGKFSKDWACEASQGYPELKRQFHRQKESLLEKTYLRLKNLADDSANS